ncbi:MAG: hypothetical protein FWG51_01195 [Firmicutes bacterium]|nr:hypothetical protein [Bacillota bacterium]
MSIVSDFLGLNFWLFVGIEITIFLSIFILSARLFRKKLYISMLCNFEGTQYCKKELEYKTGCGFNLSHVVKCYKLAAKLYKKKIKRQELYSFEKEIFANCKRLILECKNLSPVIKREYAGELYCCGIPKSIIECTDKIKKNQKADKQSLDYKIARLILISGFYYVSCFGQSIKSEKLKAVTRNFYNVLNKRPDISSIKLISANGKKMHLGFSGTHLLLDEFGNFALSKDGVLVIEFSKLNLAKVFRLKIDRAFYSDKCCGYYQNLQNFLKISFDIDGNLIAIFCKDSKYKIFQGRIFDDKIKFSQKRDFLHSSLMPGNFQNTIGGKLAELVYNSALLDCGIRGACVYSVLDGHLKAFKYEYLFKNMKLVTLFVEKKDKFNVLKIIKSIKLFNRFNFEYYIIVVSSAPVFCADENFKPDELSDTQSEFLKRHSVLIYQNKKTKLNLNFTDKILQDKVWQNRPFFSTDNFRLNELIKILYGFRFFESNKTLDFCLRKISEMNHKNYKENFENLIFLFRGQTLDGAFCSELNAGLYNFSCNFGTIGVLLYLISFINFYSDKTILEEVSFYAEFKNYKLTASKTKDTVLFHVFSAVQNLLNSEKNASENLKIFVLKLVVPVLEQKLRAQVLSYINCFEKDFKKDKFSNLYNSDFSGFQKAVLNLSVLQEEEKFLQSCILKMNLINKLLGISFNKNMVRIRPNVFDIKDFNLKIGKTNFEIGNFGYFGAEIRQRKYCNVSFISLDALECKISLG